MSSSQTKYILIKETQRAKDKKKIKKKKKGGNNKSCKKT